MHQDRATQLILWFDEITIDDLPPVGGKNASLGEMYQKLTSQGVNIPWGFAITAYSYRYLIKETHIEDLPDASFAEEFQDALTNAPPLPL